MMSLNENEYNLKENKKNAEKTINETAFRRSAKIRRSPVNTPRAIEKLPQPSISIDVEEAFHTPQNAQQKPPYSEGRTQEPPAAHSSPRQEFIMKMRNMEEETLEKCQDALRKIRQAILRQRNVNMDVQNGVSELEELFDIISSYRRNWKNAEKEKENSLSAVENLERANKSDDTPTTSHKKRNASSPAANRPGKKMKERVLANIQAAAKDRPKSDENNPKTNKLPKKGDVRKKSTRKRRERAEAVIIRPTEGHSYAEVLKNLRSNAKPEETDVAVRCIRKTKTGSILLELGKGGKTAEFCDAIRGILKEAADVKDLKPRDTIEIRDLDALTTKEEVLAAITEATKLSEDDIMVNVTETNRREQRRAFVALPVTGACELMKTERIQIGWTRCRIKYHKEVERCFRCFGIGHKQWNCDGPDRKGIGICIRCGAKGHKMKECKNSPKCCLCSQDGTNPVDHLPGSRRCTTRSQKSL